MLKGRIKIQMTRAYNTFTEVTTQDTVWARVKAADASSPSNRIKSDLTPGGSSQETFCATRNAVPKHLLARISLRRLKYRRVLRLASAIKTTIISGIMNSFSVN